MGFSLFDIDSQIREALDALYSSMDEDGCIADGDFERIEALNAERNTKIENIALYYKECVAEADALKAESKKLADRATIAANKAERLKDYLATSMQGAGETEFKSNRVKLSFRSSRSVVVPNVDLLDPRFVTEKVTFAPDKKAIKEAIDGGEIVDGAYIEEKKNIQIK